MITTQTSEEMTSPRQADKGCLLAARLACRLARRLTNLENPLSCLAAAAAVNTTLQLAV